LILSPAHVGEKEVQILYSIVYRIHSMVKHVTVHIVQLQADACYWKGWFIAR